MHHPLKSFEDQSANLWLAQAPLLSDIGVGLSNHVRTNEQCCQLYHLIKTKKVSFQE